MIVEETRRVFKYNGKELKDPAPDLSPEEAMKLYRDQFPELTNMEVRFDKVDPKTKTSVYIVNGRVGTKG